MRLSSAKTTIIIINGHQHLFENQLRDIGQVKTPFSKKPLDQGHQGATITICELDTSSDHRCASDNRVLKGELPL